MFSNTAYEALYQYLGLELHAQFIEVLTSQRVFLAVLVMIVGVMFFSTTMRFFSRYMPGVLIQRRPVPLSSYFKLVICFVVGVAVLKVDSPTSVKRFDHQSWHDNPYIARKHEAQAQYRVSFFFDILSRSAGEVAAVLSRVVDDLFKVSHSQLAAPDFFYKAITYAGTATITDPALKEAAGFFAEECLMRALPLLVDKEDAKRGDAMFRPDREVDDVLRGLAISVPDRPGYDCLDAKNDVHNRLMTYTAGESEEFRDLLQRYRGRGFNHTSARNMQASMSLVNLYMDERESFVGIQRGAQPPSGAARVIQYLNRVPTWDAVMSLFGAGAGHGASMAATRSQEFSENLSRAPHVAGFIKMALIALFPWLVFPIVAGRWKVMVWWLAAYFSVLLWTPIWTLLYHITLSISLSSEAMAAFGKLSDGVSLYGASLISSRMNYMYAVYAWLQLGVGAAFTGGFLWFMRPILTDSAQDTAPEFIDDAGKAASFSAKVAGKFA